MTKENLILIHTIYLSKELLHRQKDSKTCKSLWKEIVGRD